MSRVCFVTVQLFENIPTDFLNRSGHTNIPIIKPSGRRRASNFVVFHFPVEVFQVSNERCCKVKRHIFGKNVKIVGKRSAIFHSIDNVTLKLLTIVYIVSNKILTALTTRSSSRGSSNDSPLR